MPLRTGARYRSDPTLVQACLAGDESAWNELIERYGRLVYSIPRRYGCPEDECDDIFQSVFSILIRRLDDLRDQTRLSAWLITTTRRECWRARKRRPATAELDEGSAAEDGDEGEVVERQERRHLVREGLRLLGGRCRDLLEALFLRPSEANYEEIARELGMKVGSIGPTRARCFRKLEEILRQIGLDEPGSRVD
jgi:RNA polymerase sigma factor (sigma-70 family)